MLCQICKRNGLIVWNICNLRNALAICQRYNIWWSSKLKPWIIHTWIINWSIRVDHMCSINSLPTNHTIPKSIDQTMCWTSHCSRIQSEEYEKKQSWIATSTAMYMRDHSARTCRCRSRLGLRGSAHTAAGPSWPMKRMSSCHGELKFWTTCLVVWSDTKRVWRHFFGPTNESL